MSSIILAFIIGVLCGMGYMYMRYCKIMRGHLRELQEIKLNNARIKGKLEVLCIQNGMEWDIE